MTTKAHQRVKDDKLLRRVNLPSYQKEHIRQYWNSLTDLKEKKPGFVVSFSTALIFPLTVIALGLAYFNDSQVMHNFGLFFTWGLIIILFLAYILIFIVYLSSAKMERKAGELLLMGRVSIGFLAGPSIFKRLYQNIVALLWLILLIALGHYFIAILGSALIVMGKIVISAIKDKIKNYLDQNISGEIIRH